MRRTIIAAALGGCCGFLLAAGAAFGYAKFNAWRDFGERFQLGYVVGYLDGIKLSKRKDARALMVPSEGASDHERWRAMVNEFYADPANANRPVPDAMAEAGKKIREEVIKAWEEQRRRARGEGQGSGASPRAVEPTGGEGGARSPAVSPAP